MKHEAKQMAEIEGFRRKCRQHRATGMAWIRNCTPKYLVRLCGVMDDLTHSEDQRPVIIGMLAEIAVEQLLLALADEVIGERKENPPCE